MPSRRRVLVVRLLIALIGTLAMVATLIELKGQWALAREQRAVANLVKAGASVQLLGEENGVRYYTIGLDGCDRSKSNDELLQYVCNIGNVRALSLAPLPLREAGTKCLLDLGTVELLHLYVGDRSVPPEMYAGLKREMKRLNPNMDVQASDLDGKAVE